MSLSTAFSRGRSATSQVQVVIRLRPVRAEIGESRAGWNIDSIAKNSTIIEKNNPDAIRFSFDKIFGPTSTTRQLYQSCVHGTASPDDSDHSGGGGGPLSMIEAVVQGYNGTVFAYGQTGSGKTFTMIGDNSGSPTTPGDENSDGVVAMAVRDLFAALDREKKRINDADDGTSMRYAVHLSMIEIYNEQLRDLLAGSLSPPPLTRAQASIGGCAAPSGGSVALPLSIRENHATLGGVYVHNAVRRTVTSAAQALAIIKDEAQLRRVSASTAMNERSSRSHCMIKLLVERVLTYSSAKTSGNGNDDDDDEEDEEGLANSTSSAASAGEHTKRIISSLNLVDLAGSERVAKTGAVGQRMVEGGHINKSLTILTTVINKLTSADAAGGAGHAMHIPYRDSKLTHLLKTALGGNSLTLIICCLSTALEQVDESRSTLQFAARAKSIKNSIAINEIVDDRTRIKELELALKSVKRQLVAFTLYCWSKDVTIKRLKEAIVTGTTSGIVYKMCSVSPSASPQKRSGKTPSRRSQSGLNHNNTLMSPSSSSAASDTSSDDGEPGSRRAGRGIITTESGEVIDSAQLQQMEMLIEQLTAQNDALQQELDAATERAKRAESALEKERHADPHNMNNSNSSNDSHQAANDAEKEQLRRDVSELQEMLEESEAEVERCKASVAELESLIEDLEAENEEKDKAAAEAGKRAKTLEIEMRGLKQQERLLREQLTALQDLRRDIRGGPSAPEESEAAKLRASYTELQIKNEELRFRLGEGVSAAELAKSQAATVKELLEQRVREVSEERDTVLVQMQKLNSYCWRLLNIAALAASGRSILDPKRHGKGGTSPGKGTSRDNNNDDKENNNAKNSKGHDNEGTSNDDDAGEEEGPAAIVKEYQVDQAISQLTAFVNSRASRPPAVVDQGKKGSSPESNNNNNNSSNNSKIQLDALEGKTEDELRQKILDLEKVILTKDAQRDIIVDTKLKRIQELVLRQQAANLSLTASLRGLAASFNALYDLSHRDPRIMKQIQQHNRGAVAAQTNSGGSGDALPSIIGPVSAESIILRAASAAPIKRPLGHN